MLGKLVEGLIPDSGGATTVVRECRRCGTTLEEGVDSCPYCGETDVARFEI